MTQPTPPRIRAWTVVLAALGVNLILGSLYAWSVMGKALAGQWHWTKTQAMLPFAASTASFAITMIFAGRWQDKIGPRYVAMLGGIIFGLGMVLSSFVHTYVPMLITFGLIGGMGIGLQQNLEANLPITLAMDGHALGIQPTRRPEHSPPHQVPPILVETLVIARVEFAADEVHQRGR